MKQKLLCIALACVILCLCACEKAPAATPQGTASATLPELTRPAGPDLGVELPAPAEPPAIEDPNITGAELALRQKALDYMYRQCTYPWFLSEDTRLECTCGKHNWDLKKGVVYYGLPYTHSSGSLETMQNHQCENGAILPGADILTLVGNDCAEAVFWAWSQVSSEVCFTRTKNSLCKNGTLAVGDYNAYDKNSTEKIWEKNGEETMLAALAMLKPGDGLLKANPSGHMRMVATTPKVVYNADGTVDAGKSTLTFHEQAFEEESIAKTNSTCRVFVEVTFRELADDTYIPITIAAFSQPEADPVELTITNQDLTKSGIGKGTLQAKHRIRQVTVQFLDSQGRLVAEVVEYPQTDNEQMCKTYRMGDIKKDVMAALDTLPTGEVFTYRVVVGIADGYQTVQSFEFTN